eukprot:3707546-Prorocentrum_lima.AAC.1
MDNQCKLETVRDKHLEDVCGLWKKCCRIMEAALRKHLEGFTPPPILMHTNDETVPPTVTLGITAY